MPPKRLQPSAHANLMPFSITRQELARIDERVEAEQSMDALRALSQRLADDLKLARERLERTPSNRSMPSGSVAPRGGAARADESAAGPDQALSGEGAQAASR